MRTTARAREPIRAAGDRKPRGERWPEILRAAAEVFHERGYDAATLKDIADRVGILKGSIYYYIKTKGDLLESLLIEVHREGVEMARAAAHGPGDAIERLAAMIRAHIDYMAANQAKSVVYLQELGGLSGQRRDELFYRHEFRDEYQAVIALGQRDGMIDPALDSKLTAQSMLGCLNSIYHWFRPGYGNVPDAVARHFALTQLRGIATPQGVAAVERIVAR